MTERLRFHFSLSCIGEGDGNPLQRSCLENPRDGKAWWAAVYGVAQSWTWLKWLSSSSRSGALVSLCFLPLEWYHLPIWGCWYFSWLIFPPVSFFMIILSLSLYPPPHKHTHTHTKVFILSLSLHHLPPPLPPPYTHTYTHTHTVEDYLFGQGCQAERQNWVKPCACRPTSTCFVFCLSEQGII